MKTQISRKFVTSLTAALVATLATTLSFGPVATADDEAMAPADDAMADTADTTPDMNAQNETAPVAPMDPSTMGMGSSDSEPAAQAPAASAAKKKHMKKKHAKKLNKKKKKKTAKNNLKKKKKKKKNRSA